VGGLIHGTAIDRLLLISKPVLMRTAAPSPFVVDSSTISRTVRITIVDGTDDDSAGSSTIFYGITVPPSDPVRDLSMEGKDNNNDEEAFDGGRNRQEVGHYDWNILQKFIAFRPLASHHPLIQFL
jgi:hypothetical protein